MPKLLLTMIEVVTFFLGVGAGIVVMGRTEADAAAWLGFSGALIGAAITVLGALCVLEWQKTIEEKGRRMLLVELLSEVLEVIGKVRSPGTNPQLPPEISQLVALRNLEDAVARAQGARQWVQPDNAAMARAFSYIGKMSVSRDELENASKASRFYSQVADLSKQLDPVEALARSALIELRK